MFIKQIGKLIPFRRKDRNKGGLYIVECLKTVFWFEFIEFFYVKIFEHTTKNHKHSYIQS